MAFLKTSKVAGRHHARAIARRSRNREWPRDLLFDTGNEVFLFVSTKRIGVCPAKGQLASLDVLHTHAFPVQQVAETLRAVPLVDSLTTTLGAKVVHERGQLIDRVVDTLRSSVHNVDSVVAGVLDEFLHVATETRQVGCDARNAHDCALGGGVAPGLVVGREDTHVAATHEVVVVERQHGVRGVEELGVEDNLDTIGRVIEELHSANLVQHRVLAIADHVVRDDWW